MEVNIIKNEGQEKILEITVPWQIIEEEYKDIVRKYSKLPLKGFRPGKAPAGAIESFFRNEIKNELLSATSARICRAALKQQEMEAGTGIELSDAEISKGNFIRFKAGFIEMPAFSLPDYRDLQLESESSEEKLDEISRKLLDLTDITLHPSFIENEQKYSDPEENLSPEEDESISERVKLMLILKKIAAQDAIEIDDNDVNKRIELIAEENEVGQEELRNYLVENNGLSRLADTLLAEAVLHYIIDIQV